MPTGTFASRVTLPVGDAEYREHRLDALERASIGHVDRLPVSPKVLLEILLWPASPRTPASPG